MNNADPILERKFADAIRAAKSLFDRGKTSGSSANLSFLHEGNVYITASGSCFGFLTREDFAIVAPDGTILNGKKPSKELPLHLGYYEKDPNIQAVIHTHGPYAVLWSCRRFDGVGDVIPKYTPYLEMKVGKIGLIPYHPPGSQALFDAFRERRASGDAFLLKNHGAIVGGKTVTDAFYGIEELEESARIACMIEGPGVCDRIP